MLDYYVVDAFADRIFEGNPAGVCILEEWLPSEKMQKIAMENCLSETAFAVKVSEGNYEIRWFTPKCEIDLCGHATFGRLMFCSAFTRLISKNCIFTVCMQIIS